LIQEVKGHHLNTALAMFGIIPSSPEPMMNKITKVDVKKLKGRSYSSADTEAE
jgi:hypothetical protein